MRQAGTAFLYREKWGLMNSRCEICSWDCTNSGESASPLKTFERTCHNLFKIKRIVKAFLFATFFYYTPFNCHSGCKTDYFLPQPQGLKMFMGL
jgi:hypothetical protein